MERGQRALRRKMTICHVLLLAFLTMVCMMGYAEGTAQTELTNGEMVELKVGESVKIAGNYTIVYEDVIMVSDETLQQGYWWYYVSSTDDGAEEKRLEYPVGTHMPIFVHYRFTNLNTSDTELLGRIQGKLVYDNKYAFDVTPMQINPNQVTGRISMPYYENRFTAAHDIPNQVTNGGNQGRVSTVGRLVEPLVSVDLWLCGNVPVPIRDSKKPFVAMLTVDETNAYKADLRTKEAVRID